jgi:hypothetical protein
MDAAVEPTWMYLPNHCKYSDCRSGVLAAIGCQINRAGDGAPTVLSQNLTSGDFRNPYIHFILY